MDVPVSAEEVGTILAAIDGELSTLVAVASHCAVVERYSTRCRPSRTRTRVATTTEHLSGHRPEMVAG
jgi:hypothetical protein